MMKLGDFESFIVKGQYNCVSDNRTYTKPFIPIVTEYLLLFQKKDPLVFQFAKTMTGIFDVTKQDDPSITWHHLIRSTMESLGGKADLQTLYIKLTEHPKAKKNANFKARIRATIYEHPDQYLPCDKGYKLSYKVA